MPKITYILALTMLYSILSYGQEITFHKNVNYRANTLEQSLNKDGNILFLESKTEQIKKVEIFNEDYSESIAVNDNETTIDLKTLPNGNFVIQAKVENQWIIMYLEKNEDTKIASSIEMNKNEDATIMSSFQKEKITKDRVLPTIPNTPKIDKLKTHDNPIFYWVVHESNSSFGSSKTMRLEYKEDVDKLIIKNKLELKSSVGKKNKLIIYEVYDKSAFMNKQFRNPTYYKSAEASKFLNAEPLYASSDNAEDDF